MRTLLMLAFALAAGCAERHEAEGVKAASLEDLVKQASAAKPVAEPVAKADAAQHGIHAVVGPAPLEALARLSAGNARFANNRRQRSTITVDDGQERAATASGQKPFATILTCADSRLPPELIFDQSIGDLFVIRNAGNIAEPICEGSVEYAVEHLGVRLVVVMGHSSCGAVTAVGTATDKLPGHLADIQSAMPGLREFFLARGAAGLQRDAAIADSVERNATAQAAALVASSDVLRNAVADGRLAVLPAVYDLSSGTVGFLPPTDIGSAGVQATGAAHSGH
jgi:carbonic anhydrase